MARLLILDGDSVTLQTWAHFLHDAGHDVDTAPCGGCGLDAVRSREYDLILTDLFLGDISAIELLDEMKATRHIVATIVVTGSGTIETAVAAMRHGAVNYVLKPLTRDDLLRQVALGLEYSAIARPGAGPSAKDHAAARWAQAVVGLLRARADVRTLGEWARTTGLSSSTLRTHCEMAGLSPKRSLTLARMLRAVFQSQHTTWRPAQRLDVIDPRTLRRMLTDCGLLDAQSSVTIHDLLTRQNLINDEAALRALHEALREIDSPRDLA